MSQPRPTICLPILGCLLALSAAGCQTYAPYGYGGQGNYSYPVYQPGAVVPYNGPVNGVPGTMQGGVILPGQTFPQGGPPPGAFGPGGAPPFNPGANPAYQLPPVNRSPGFGVNPQIGVQGVDAAGDNFGPPGQFPGAGANTPNPPNPLTRPKMPADERFPAVPDYPDPTSQPASSVRPRTGPPKGAFGGESIQDDMDAGRRETQKLKEIETEDPLVPAAALPKKTSMIIHDGDEQFLPPLNSQGGQPQIIQTAQHTERAPAHRPYGRAGNRQAWFRGVVDFDEQEKTWYLIYNPNPDEDDERGGIVTLLDHPNLQFVRGDDTVLIEGVFVPDATDRYGHPRYRINTIKRLVAPQ
jgi:hypothetical protein